MLLFTSIDRKHFYICSNLALAKYPLLQNQSVEFPQIFKICYLFNYIIIGCVYHGHYHQVQINMLWCIVFMANYEKTKQNCDLE